MSDKWKVTDTVKFIIRVDEGKTEIGQIVFYVYSPYAWIGYIGVRKGHQRRGVGERLYREFIRYMQAKYPQIRQVRGSCTSKGILRLRNKVFGKPVRIKGSVRHLPLWSEAKRFRGFVAKRYVTVTHRLPKPVSSSRPGRK